jgi:hypothetical protein
MRGRRGSAFNMNDDLILALNPAVSLTKDAKVTTTPARLGAVSLGRIVKSNGEVDTVMKQGRRTSPRGTKFGSIVGIAV